MVYKVELKRQDCIGCGACASVCPDFFKMNDDGKPDLKGSKKIEANGKVVGEELEVKDDDSKKIKEAVDTCPVNAIQINKKAE